jgi:Uma2 family endonuclease
LRSGRAQLILKPGRGPRRCIELEGPPDLIVEVVSDASLTKDTRRLPEAHFRAGVGEYWLVDARSGEILFQIHHRGPSSFQPAQADPEGFQPSVVLSCHYRLDGARDPRGCWTFDLREKKTQ